MAYPTDPIYKFVKSPYTGENIGIKKQIDNLVSQFPFDEGNRDYQDYLEWVAEGNTAEAAD
tara:strand:+ start:1144 stop:1326 length:183 start_codon:yes stop_codon:yes gene_type:complete